MGALVTSGTSLLEPKLESQGVSDPDQDGEGMTITVVQLGALLTDVILSPKAGSEGGLLLTMVKVGIAGRTD